MIALFESSFKKRQHTSIEQLAYRIEKQWLNSLDISEYYIPKDLGYIEGNLESEKLIIENRCYQTPQFRKLHLELAQVGDLLDILHCVMFPRTNYDLPIFGADLICSKAGMAAAIVDLSPVNGDRSLPETYSRQMADLPSIDFTQPRTLPPWGHIFSKFCLFVQPKDSQEEELFLDRVCQYLTIHCQTALTTSPLTSSTKQAEIRWGQRYYCSQQQQNDKTRRVLEKSLGQAWTERYMTQMLFDCP